MKRIFFVYNDNTSLHEKKKKKRFSFSKHNVKVFNKPQAALAPAARSYLTVCFDEKNPF